MEILREQSLQQQEAFENLLVDLERRISSGEKFFVRKEMEPEIKDMQRTFDEKEHFAGSKPKPGMRTVFYLIEEVGESDCIYRNRPLSDYYSVDPGRETLRTPEMTRSFNLVAIRTQLKYYICRPGDLGIDASTVLPDYVEMFSDTVKYYNEYLQNTAFPSFYHKLQPYELKPNAAMIYKARLAAFEYQNIYRTCGVHEGLPYSNLLFTDHEVQVFVCNGVSPEDAAWNRLAEEDVINTYRTCKSENEMIQKLIKNEDLYSNEERKLWDAVASQPNDARTLTVTFHFRGRTENLQIKPEAIREVLLNKVFFKAIDIAPSSRSDFFAMGAAPWSDGEKSTLTCEHITKITYWDTVLFEKKPEQQIEKSAEADTNASGLSEVSAERVSEPKSTLRRR